MKSYSEASKKRWAQIPPEKRSEMMRKLALQKSAKMTPEEKSAHGRMMRNKQLKKEPR